MTEREETLLCGNVADSVIRIGNTVRKPATSATPAVHSLLTHLRSEGFVGDFYELKHLPTVLINPTTK